MVSISHWGHFDVDSLGIATGRFIAWRQNLDRTALHWDDYNHRWVWAA
jgi:hypothetical protein